MTIDRRKFALRLVSFRGDAKQNQFVGSIYLPKNCGRGSCPTLSFYTKGFGQFNHRQAKTWITKCKPHGIELAMVELELVRVPGEEWPVWKIPGIDL